MIAKLTALHNVLHSDTPYTPKAWRLQLQQLLASNGRIWVMVKGATVIGYAMAASLPGLPHIADVVGGVSPQWRRQGYGSRLLRHLLADLGELRVEMGWQQLSCGVESGDGRGAFLQANGFFVEHEEVALRLQLREAPARVKWPPSLSVVTLPWQTAVTTFIHLYDAAFSPHPWYQPYTVDEVVDSLEVVSDLLFLMVADEPVGFIWMQKNEKGSIVEPIGVLPQWQGRGYGRFLLLTALQRWWQQRETAVQIGVWRSNKAALHLYEAMGFVPEAVYVHWAYNLA